MAANRSWAVYSPTYRAREMEILAGWIQTGLSGAVVGAGGTGKSNLMGFLSHRPDALQPYLDARAGSPEIVVVPMDLNNLPANTPSTFYRVVLRSFYEIRARFEPSLQQQVTQLYLENRAERDPFLSQSALRELLLTFQAQQIRVVLVMDRFDYFCQIATPQLTNTLRGLRDSFKDTLCYIVGMRHEIVYLAEVDISSQLGELYELLDTHVCWVGPMDAADARQLIAQETEGKIPHPWPEETLNYLLNLTGGYPALLKASCHWWLNATAQADSQPWQDRLLVDPSIQYRIEEILAGLTQEERLVVAEVALLDTEAQRQHPKKMRPSGKGGDNRFEQLAKQHGQTLARLVSRGVCRRVDSGWQVVGELVAAYVAGQEEQAGGKIWLDSKTGELYRGQASITELAPLERSLLSVLVKTPGVRHTKSELIENVWPDDELPEGITDDSLYQVIKKLRRKIEPNPAKPSYIINWRGQPEGGYQFFPEGRPG